MRHWQDLPKLDAAVAGVLGAGAAPPFTLLLAADQL